MRSLEAQKNLQTPAKTENEGIQEKSTEKQFQWPGLILLFVGEVALRVQGPTSVTALMS